MRSLRWTAYGLVSAAYLLSFFHRVAPAAIASELRRTFQATGAELGALAAAYFAVYTVMQVPTGVLVDTLGPRRIVTLGGLLAGIGSVAFGLAGTLGLAAAGRALVGVGVSVTFVSLLKLVASWFREREFATITGLTVLMGNVGALLAAVPLAWAVGLTPWGNLFVGIGLFSLGLALLTWFLVRDSPAEAGLPSMRELDGQESHAPHPGRWYQGLWLVVKNGASWPGFFVSLGVGGAYLTFAGLWAVPYLTAVHRMPTTVATYHTSLMMLGFALGSLAAGHLSDRMGRRRPLILWLATLFFLTWLPLIAGVRLPLPVTLALFAMLGATAAAFTVTWSSAKELNPPALSGTAISVVNAGGFLGTTILQPLVGWVLDWSSGSSLPAPAGAAAIRPYGPEDFRWGMAVMGAFALLGLVSAFFVRETFCRNVSAD
jgi:sugar phosphate permease